MTNQTHAPASAALYGGSLIVAIDLNDAVLLAVMAAADALLCGLLDEALLTAPDGAPDPRLEDAASGALMDEDAYIDWLAEKWGYADADVRRDSLVSHFGRR